MARRLHLLCPSLLCLLLCLLPCFAWAQGSAPQATLDRDTVHLGETVTLNIRVDGATDLGRPDLAPLAQDFIVLGTSNNSSLSIVNGQRSVQTTVGVALRPLRTGILRVPSLQVAGQRTEPLQLVVEAADASTPATNGPVLLEAGVDPATAYVGQQVDYTLRLYYAVSLTDGALGDPQADGAEIRRQGNDANYVASRGGRRYNVVERHYAIFPQHDGELVIKPATFQGEAADPNDPGAFFGSATPVNATANPVKLAVRAHPAEAGAGAWLPARALTLVLDGLPADGKARVGEPLTLTMRLHATGLPFEALPALSLPKIEGADVYPDKAVTGTSDDGHWLTGRREQTFAVVPNRPGRLRIPETTLRWWNVVSDRLETARIPEHAIDVAASATAAPATAGAAPSASASVPATDSAPAAPGAPAPQRWHWLGLTSLVLWAVTVLAVLAWWLLRRRRAAAPIVDRPDRPKSAREWRQAFLAAAGEADPARQEATLLAWARIEQPALRSLGDLSTALASSAQREAIASLQRARFAGVVGEDGGEALRWAFERGFAWSTATRSPGGDAPLPPLYPR